MYMAGPKVGHRDFRAGWLYRDRKRRLHASLHSCKLIYASNRTA